jgi:hypothetical protein
MPVHLAKRLGEAHIRAIRILQPRWENVSAGLRNTDVGSEAYIGEQLTFSRMYGRWDCVLQHRARVESYRTRKGLSSKTDNSAPHRHEQRHVSREADSPSNHLDTE